MSKFKVGDTVYVKTTNPSGAFSRISEEYVLCKITYYNTGLYTLAPIIIDHNNQVLNDSCDDYLVLAKKYDTKLWKALNDT